MKTLYCTKEHSRRSVILMERAAQLGRETLSYRLLVAGSTLSVMILGENGVGVVKSLGKDLDVAEWIFDLLVEHTVAPCHLSEIVEELLENRDRS